jgi:hypothetical protein
VGKDALAWFIIEEFSDVIQACGFYLTTIADLRRSISFAYRELPFKRLNFAPLQYVTNVDKPIDDPCPRTCIPYNLWNVGETGHPREGDYLSTYVVKVFYLIRDI